MWRLGAALAADGKETEALTSYIESYKTDKPDYAKYAVVEALYKKLNGNTDGLEEMIGRERVALTPAIQEIRPNPIPSPSPDTSPASVPAATSETALPATDSSTSVSPASVAPTPAATTAAAPDAAARPDPTADQKDIAPAKIEEMPKREVPIDKLPGAKVDIPVEEPKPATDDQPAKTDTSPSATIKEPAKADTETKTPETKPEPDIRETTPASHEDKPPPGEPAENLTAKNPKTSEPKSLFEPIIITIPKSRPVKLSTDSAKKDNNDSSKKPADAEQTTTAGRQRVIDGPEAIPVESPPCVVGVSQENVSLINDGGSVGILVSVETPGDIKSLKGISSSPKDVELTLQPEIGGISDRRFYVIKSISPAVGIYQITFATDCGKKEVIVTVR